MHAGRVWLTFNFDAVLISAILHKMNACCDSDDGTSYDIVDIVDVPLNFYNCPSDLDCEVN